MTGRTHQISRIPSAFIAPSSSIALRDGMNLHSNDPVSFVEGRSITPSSSTLHQSIFDNFPTSTIAEANAVAAAAPSTTFEPVMPETSLLVGFGAVALLCVIAANVWANEVVPVSRTKLAISKSRGEVREYLDELKEGSITSSETSQETTMATEGENTEAPMVKPNVGDGRDFERWLFSDWLNNDNGSGKPGRQKEPALPVLKKAKWNSGDNPVLVTSAIMLLGVLIASVTERVSSLSGTV